VILDLCFELVGLMLLKLLELLGAALDPLPFIGQLVFFVKVGVI
jgi:hypothetical protein